MFAIYYFKADKAVEVGNISWMTEEDQQKTLLKITQCPNLEDESDWLNVNWSKNKRKKGDPVFYPAKVLMFGGEY